MTGWLDTAYERAARGDASVLVTICSVDGSAPREPGTKMLVWAEGQDGTIGGGNLEFIVVQQARKLLAAGDAFRLQSYPLGPLLGQCCGGRVGILMERIAGESMGWLRTVSALESRNLPYAICSRLQGGRIEKTVIDGSGRLADNRVDICSLPGGAVVSRDAVLTGDLIIQDHVAPLPSLFMFGAGHVGRALAPVAAGLPLRVNWFDTRSEFGAVDGPLQPVVTPDLVAEVETAPAGSLFLIFTQSHELDFSLTRAVLERGDALYCGLIGSKTKRARFERRLRSDGLSAAAIRHLTCPIGAIGLVSKNPAVLAVAIAAEVMLTAEAGQSQTSARAVHAR